MILLAIFLPASIYSQSVAFEIGYPTVYPGWEHSCHIVVEGVACDDLYVTATHAAIVPSKQSCSYIFTAALIGYSTLSIYQVQENDTLLIETKDIRVKEWPEQLARYGGQTSGTMGRSYFLANIGVICRISGFSATGSHEIVSYGITVVRDKEKLFTCTNYGGRLEPINKKKLKVVQENDTVIFDEIYANMPGELDSRKLNDIKLHIKD